MTFWTTATTEDRLAQIDGGIECGMTSKQIAMCLGAPIYDRGNAVDRFARDYGRSFSGPDAADRRRINRSGGKVASVLRIREKRLPEMFNKDAFAIFDTPRDPNPFASLSFDEVDA